MLVIQTGSAEVTEDKVEQSVTTNCRPAPLWSKRQLVTRGCSNYPQPVSWQCMWAMRAGGDTPLLKKKKKKGSFFQDKIKVVNEKQTDCLQPHVKWEQPTKMSQASVSGRRVDKAWDYKRLPKFLNVWLWLGGNNYTSTEKAQNLLKTSAVEEPGGQWVTTNFD